MAQFSEQELFEGILFQKAVDNTAWSRSLMP